MWDAPLIKVLGEGRFHLRHGPIDLLVNTNSDHGQVKAALEYVFPAILPELCEELSQLRKPVQSNELAGPVARIAERSALPFADKFVTPMAAIAGAVAEYLLSQLKKRLGDDEIWINNGGDIAFCGPKPVRIGICADVENRRMEDQITINPTDGIGGVATSGWRGRSHSFGIADAVTVLAETASIADVAATMIANATNIEDASILRVPANELNPDSDLGARLVTVDVPSLGQALRETALDAGLEQAQAYLRRGLIAACFISLQGEKRILNPQKVQSVA